MNEIIHTTNNVNSIGGRIVVAIVESQGVESPCVCRLVPAHGPYSERLETLVLFSCYTPGGDAGDDARAFFPKSREAIECADEWID